MILKKLRTSKRTIQRFFWSFYKRTVVPLVKLFSCAFDVDEKKIIFDNFLGKGFSDNPKMISEEFHKTNPEWKIVWLLNNIDDEIPDYIMKVKYGSARAMFEMATAKIWVDNVRNADKPRKKQTQIYLQTWHGGGMPLKLIEAQAEDKLSRSYVKKAKYDGSITDAILSPDSFTTQIYKDFFWLNENTEILQYGSPRNDILFEKKNNIEYIETIKKKLGISSDDYVILYAPTFRDDDSKKGYTLDFNAIVSQFMGIHDKQVKIVIRLHPNVKDKSFVNFNENVICGDDIASAQDLALVSDMLITDYSTVFYDFMILKKPVVLCTLDLDEYKKKRGLSPLFDELPFPRANSNEDLLTILQGFNVEEYNKKMTYFWRKNDVFDNGHATKNTVQWLNSKVLE